MYHGCLTSNPVKVETQRIYVWQLRKDVYKEIQYQANNNNTVPRITLLFCLERSAIMSYCLLFWVTCFFPTLISAMNNLDW